MAKPSKRAQARKPKKPAAAKARAAKRRKPRQARSKPNPITDTLVWEGLTIAITYEARWFGGSSPQSFSHSHLQLRVTDPADAPLPITETGYRSHFLRDGIVEEVGGPVAYVRRWLDEAARHPSWPASATAGGNTASFRSHTWTTRTSAGDKSIARLDTRR